MQHTNGIAIFIENFYFQLSPWMSCKKSHTDRFVQFIERAWAACGKLPLITIGYNFDPKLLVKKSSFITRKLEKRETVLLIVYKLKNMLHRLGFC